VPDQSSLCWCEPDLAKEKGISYNKKRTIVCYDMTEVFFMARKVYLRVVAEFDEQGRLSPRALTWEDGRSYPVDRVLAVCPAASFKVGGCGIRYTCRIQGQLVYLFQDGNRWYLEDQTISQTTGGE
jgi:hypothetical protein